MKFLTLSFLFLAQFLFAEQNFNTAKKELTEFYKANPQLQKDFYCNAPFKWVKNRFEIIPSENYSPRNPKTKKGKINQRTKRIEWEHIMPAHNFGRHLPCWKDGGRKACKDDKLFNKMEADKQNLVPAIGEINGDRSNYRYAQAPKDLDFNQYGNCQVYTDFRNKRFYPADYSKGWTARSYLYMSKTYNIRLSNQEKKLMESWDKMYPMSETERLIRSFK